jgi:hypothetical protein
MSGFRALEHFAPSLTLLVGLVQLIGSLGIGLGLLSLAEVRYPSPWRQVAGLVLGFLALSTMVQLLSFAGLASRTVLESIWLIAVAYGCWEAVRELRRVRWPNWIHPNRRDAFPLAIALVGNSVNLVVALAPSTKIDELYYHMLLPARIVLDQGLVFYREPWPAAVLPQMEYQIAAAPLHALGVPDAMNVSSWGLSVVLQMFTWCILRQRQPDSPLAGIMASSFAVGIFPVVAFVTGGSNAFGILAATGAVTALLMWSEMRQSMTGPQFVALVSILAVAAAASKVSMLPFAVLAVVLAALTAWRGIFPSTDFVSLALAVLLPWLIFFVPLAIWTYVHSGSPFGPMFAGKFGESVYDVALIQETLQQTRAANQVPVSEIVKYAVANHPPQVWAGMILLAWPRLNVALRVMGMVLAGLQLVILMTLIQFDLRFFGGIQFGLTLGCLTELLPRFRGMPRSGVAITVAAGILLLPWLGVQIYYAYQFFPVVLGLQEKEEFYSRYLAFYQDFRELDRLLPPDAVLLVQGSRVDSVYAPRAVFFDPKDIPAGRPTYLFRANLPPPASSGMVGYEVGELIYQNGEAIVAAYRTPWLQSSVGPLRIYRMKRMRTESIS